MSAEIKTEEAEKELKTFPKQLSLPGFVEGEEESLLALSSLAGSEASPTMDFSPLALQASPAAEVLPPCSGDELYPESSKSLMQPQEQELSAGKSNAHIDLREIPHRWFEVLAMHMAGHSYPSISDRTGYSAVTISRILHDDRMRILRYQYLDLYEAEFLTLYPKFNASLIKLLSSADEKSNAAGAALFSKHLGLIKKVEYQAQVEATKAEVELAKAEAQAKAQANQTNITLSAEEVVFNILNQK